MNLQEYATSREIPIKRFGDVPVVLIIGECHWDNFDEEEEIIGIAKPQIILHEGLAEFGFGTEVDVRNLGKRRIFRKGWRRIEDYERITEWGYKFPDIRFVGCDATKRMLRRCNEGERYVKRENTMGNIIRRKAKPFLTEPYDGIPIVFICGSLHTRNEGITVEDVYMGIYYDLPSSPIYSKLERAKVPYLSIDLSKGGWTKYCEF